MFKTSYNTSCPICFDEVDIRDIKLICRHKFHYDCIKQILNNKCPLCQQLIIVDMSYDLYTYTHLIFQLVCIGIRIEYMYTVRSAYLYDNYLYFLGLYIVICLFIEWAVMYSRKGKFAISIIIILILRLVYRQIII